MVSPEEAFVMQLDGDFDNDTEPACSLLMTPFIGFKIWPTATAITNAQGVRTQTLDWLGRLLTRTAPDSGVEKYLYTARGLVGYTNQLSKGWRYEYDAATRKITETNANTEIIRYTYNAASDLLTLRDGKNQVTTWNYDQYGRVTNKIDQVSASILRYQYDVNSRLTNRWSAAKGSTAYSWDAVGNLTLAALNLKSPSSIGSGNPRV